MNIDRVIERSIDRHPGAWWALTAIIIAINIFILAVVI